MIPTMTEPIRDTTTRALREWLASTRARVDSLRVGAHGRAIDGEVYRLDRVDGAHSGVYHVTRVRDGAPTCFAGCAEWGAL